MFHENETTCIAEELRPTYTHLEAQNLGLNCFKLFELRRRCHGKNESLKSSTSNELSRDLMRETMLSISSAVTSSDYLQIVKEKKYIATERSANR